MRPRSVAHLVSLLTVGALALLECGPTLPRPVADVVVRPLPSSRTQTSRVANGWAAPASPHEAPAPSPASVGDSAGAPADATTPLASASAPAPTPSYEPEPAAPHDGSPAIAGVGRCAAVPPLLPNGAVPPSPPHHMLGEDVPVPGDRAAYVLPGESGDPRVIIYLPGMCGDVTAADHFRDAVRSHGTLIAVRGDTACDAPDRFKWRDDPIRIQARIKAAFEQVNAQRQGELSLSTALLFGYSQGAERAERVVAAFPQQYPRVVLGGPPTKASVARLGRASRVAILGGELETTENMRAGAEALSGGGVNCRFFALECAYHGYFGIRAESQLTEVLDWVTAR